MKNRLRIPAMAVAILMTAGCLSSCLRKPPEENKEDKIRFGTFSQQERKDYINDFLESRYGCSGRVSEVRQKQIDPFRSEDHYFATVRTPEDDVISVWVSKEGEITDTVFLRDIQPQLSDFFSEILGRSLPDFKLRAYTEMRAIPTEKLTKAENIKRFLMEQDTFSYLRVFVEDPALLSEALLDDLEQELNFCQGTVYLYVCDDLDTLDIETCDLYSYQLSRDLQKAK